LPRNTGHAYRSFKWGSEIPEWKIRPHCGATCRQKCLFSCLSRKAWYYQNIFVSGRCQYLKHSEFKCINVTSSMIVKLFWNVQLKAAYFYYNQKMHN
jgi:hypothetical protein